VEYAQGHASAFGISILEEKLDAFKKYVYNQLKDFDFSKCYYVDFIWSTADAEQNKDTILKLGELNSIWGQGLARPRVALEHIVVTAENLRLMGEDKNKPTLKISLSNDVSLIKFRSSHEEYEKLYSEKGCVIIDIVGTCNNNVWNGIISPQIEIEDYEIVSKSAYYF
jgi:single-stranded DNA-specific DHH superfamily exonuclease